LNAYKERDAIRRLMTHITQMSELVPDSLYFGENTIELAALEAGRYSHDLANPSGEGSYATIYKGSRVNPARPTVEQENVAIKCLKYMAIGTDEEKSKRKQVSTCIIGPNL
jgi:hypothetical protein